MSSDFPTTVFDKLSTNHDDLIDVKTPDHSDHLRYCEEIIAVQNAFVDASAVGTSWTALTPANSWTGAAIKYRKIGEWIWLTGVGTAGTKTDGTTITTLPAGARPATALNFAVAPDSSGTGDANMRILIGTDGTVKCYGLTATTTISFAGVNFFTDQ